MCILNFRHKKGVFIIKEFTEDRLPRNAKEGIVYGAIICAISALVMSAVNISLNFGKFDTQVALIILKAFPFAFIIAMLMENFIVGRIAEKMVHNFSDANDSFNAKILFTVFFTVIGMSFTMTIIGDMLGNGISLASFAALSHWPRNFCIALFCELLLAQPPARFAMKKIHLRQEENLTVKDNSSIDFD